MVRAVNAASGLALNELVCTGRETQQRTGFGYQPSQPRAALAPRRAREQEMLLRGTSRLNMLCTLWALAQSCDLQGMVFNFFMGVACKQDRVEF